MMKRLLIIAAAVALVPAGCKRKEPQPPQTGPETVKSELMLYCGAGIRPPVEELINEFFLETGMKIATDYAGSEVLLSKIKIGRRGDLYMPGDKYYIEQAAGQDMILTSRPVCYWVPTILVQKGNPKGITGLKDLLKPGIKLGLGDAHACAIGRITQKVLAKNGIVWGNVKKNLAYQALTVVDLGMQIQARSLDAVIVWDATAQYYSKYGDEVPIAPEKNVISSVDIGVLKFTKNRELAEKFVAFILSPRGREIFKRHNYTVEPPE